MFAYIKGSLTYKSPALIVVEAYGIGYQIHVPLSTYAVFRDQELVTVYTHLLVREDSHLLFGFATPVERILFVQLIGVTGVGATTAQLIMSAMTVEEIRGAIVGEQAHLLQQVKGIGAKTAKQIILDLKSKIVKDAGEPAILSSGSNLVIREEALSALLALGFNRIQVQKALNQVIEEQGSGLTLEVLIKKTLQVFAGQ
jgi:Holliday junction DNA helicase RuvA